MTSNHPRALKNLSMDLEARRRARLEENAKLIAELESDAATFASAAATEIVSSVSSVPRPRKRTSKASSESAEPVVYRRSPRLLKNQGIVPSGADGDQPQSVEPPAPQQRPQPPPPRLSFLDAWSRSYFGRDQKDEDYDEESRLALSLIGELNRNLIAAATGTNTASTVHDFPAPTGLQRMFEPVRLVKNRAAVAASMGEGLGLFIAGSVDGELGLARVSPNRVQVLHTQPFTQKVSGIAFARHSPYHMFASSTEPSVRRLDIERMEFVDAITYPLEPDTAVKRVKMDEPITTASIGADDGFSSMCVNDHGTGVYIGDHDGQCFALDVRSGLISAQWRFHNRKITCLDMLEHRIVSSSNDQRAHLWDIRSIRGDEPEPIASFAHTKSVNSAMLSSSSVLTTSYDDSIGVWDHQGNLLLKLAHDNQTGSFNGGLCVPLSHSSLGPPLRKHSVCVGRYVHPFRARWIGDSAFCIGNMKRGIDVFTLKGDPMTATLETFRAPEMSIVSAIAVHPQTRDMKRRPLIGAMAYGNLNLWA